MLKKFTLFFTLGILISRLASAQCATCTPVDCSATKPLGGLCNTMPDDTANQFYDAVISFYMPYKLTDASTLAQCQCNFVNLRHITVTGIQGLPVGMSYTLSNAGGEYDVQTGDTLGCARICGTPIAPGIYPIVVNLLADVTANGTPIGSVSLDDQSQTYKDTIEIFPGTSACPVTFDLGNGCITSSCTEVTTNLTGTLSNANCPNLISYAWDLGNGQNSNAKNPGTVVYSTPDTFPLSLTTTFYTYRVKTVSVSVTGGYTGDIEELSGLQNSDPFIKINALGFNNRGCGGAGHPCDNNSQTFANINVVIPDNQCATPFDIEVWDEDGSIAPTISPDDLINTHTITPSIPNQVGSLLNNSSIGVLFDTVATSSVTETVDIIIYPLPVVPQLVFEADTICGGDSIRVSIAQQYDGFAYTWYKDSVVIPPTDSFFYAKQAGVYKVTVTNLVTGCSETSTEDSLVVATAAPNAVTVLWNGSQHFVTPFPASGFAVEWYYNGNLVAGQTGKFLPFYGQGVYEAILYNTSFPSCRRVAAADTLNNVGIEDVANGTINDINVYPNPNTGKFNIAFNAQTTEPVTITVIDLLGREVYNQRLDNFSGDYNGSIDLSNVDKGIYSLWLQSGNIKANKKVVVQ
jgi:hypothetical protein